MGPDLYRVQSKSVGHVEGKLQTTIGHYIKLQNGFNKFVFCFYLLAYMGFLNNMHYMLLRKYFKLKLVLMGYNYLNPMILLNFLQLKVLEKIITF